MARDPKKHEKKVMKRRRQLKKAAKQQTPAFAALSPRSLIRKARSFPIMDCLISQGWESSVQELIQIIVARQQPDGAVAFGVYLVDRGCLGLKNTFCNAGFTVREYQEDIFAVTNMVTPLEECPPELAHQIIYQAIDYAAKLGFKPSSDFKWSQLILEPRGTFAETTTISFGQFGMPLYYPGPDDNVKAVLAKLDASVGPGNYTYVPVLIGDAFDDDYDDDYDDEYDEEYDDEDVEDEDNA